MPRIAAASRADGLGGRGAGRGQGQVAHLAAGPRLALAVEVQMRARQGEHALPGRLDRRRRAAAKPEVAEQVEHHRRRMQARRDQRRAGHRPHLQVELRQVAGIDAVVARVVRPRRHLVGDERAAVEHEQLDAEHADVADRRGDALGQGHRLGRGGRRRPPAPARGSAPGCRRGARSPAPAGRRSRRRRCGRR